MQRARPTRMSPERRPGSSGRKAQERASWKGESQLGSGRDGEEEQGTYHEEGRDDPVHEHAEPELLPDCRIAEDLVQRLKLDAAEDGVHHDEKADGDGNGDVDELAAL